MICILTRICVRILCRRSGLEIFNWLVWIQWILHTPKLLKILPKTCACPAVHKYIQDPMMAMNLMNSNQIVHKPKLLKQICTTCVCPIVMQSVNLMNSSQTIHTPKLQKLYPKTCVYPQLRREKCLKSHYWCEFNEFLSNNPYALITKLVSIQ